MNPRSFIRPDRSEFDRLALDDGIQQTYTGSLALIHDLLCEFAPDQGRPQFQDEADLIARIESIYAPDKGGGPLTEADRPILENIERNAHRAIALRAEARSPRSLTDASALGVEISDFLDALVSTYGDVIRPKAGGLRRPRAARA